MFSEPLCDNLQWKTEDKALTSSCISQAKSWGKNLRNKKTLILQSNWSPLLLTPMKKSQKFLALISSVPLADLTHCFHESENSVKVKWKLWCFIGKGFMSI